MAGAPPDSTPDAGERAHAARMRALALAASRTVGARTESELFEIVRDAAEAVVPADAFTFGLYDARRDALDFLTAVDLGQPTGGGSVPLEGTPAETVIRERRPLVTLRSSDTAAAGSRLIGTGRPSESIIRVPILTPDAVLGMLSVQSYAQDAYDDEDVWMMEILAGNVATALTNIRLLTQVSAERERFRAVLNALPVGVVTAEASGSISDWNPSARRMWGIGAAGGVAESIESTADYARFRGRRADTGEELQAGDWPLARALHGEAVLEPEELIIEALDGLERVVLSHARPLHDARGAIEGAVATAVDITELRHAERALRASEERLRVFGEQVAAVLWMTDADLRITWAAGGAMSQMLPEGASFIGRPIEEVIRSDAAARKALSVHRAALAGEARSYDGRLHGRAYEAHVEPLRDARGEIIGVTGLAVDVTERASLEQKLREAQRMEAIGRLAGGVAHDFNNILTVIDGYLDLAIGELDQDHPTRPDLEAVREASARAGAVTGQLLAFSRRQVLRPQVLELNGVVRDMQTMLRRLIGEDLELRVQLDPAARPVEVDPGQIQQVVLNLVVNARDALPDGGVITITTGTERIDDAAAAQYPYAVETGSYTRLAVHDTGGGIPPEALQQVFEPFFTTKEKGKGTGLGLATVYGIVKQSGGYIWADSDEAGTTFRVYLPAVAPDARQPERAAGTAREQPEDGGETILIAEDEDAVRSLSRRILERRGYTVLVARDGEEALGICADHAGGIDLLLTDVVMPRMSGRELAERVAALEPDMRVLFMSGYTEDEMLRRGIVRRDVAFLQKPFRSDQLSARVREVLDG